jgi:hypothetical protein
MPLGLDFDLLHHDDSFIKILSRESPIDAMALERDSGQSRDVGGENKQKPPQRGEKMKKTIGMIMLSAVAMLAAPAAPKAQNTTAPAATTSTKKATKKHVKKVKAVKPAAAATATPSK